MTPRHIRGASLGPRGRTEERVAILTRLLERRFGPLPPETSARIAAADPDALELWLDRVLTEGSLDGVFSDETAR